MAALNVVDALGPKAEILKDYLRTLPARDPNAVARANSYVSRLLETILGEKPRTEGKKPARKKAK